MPKYIALLRGINVSGKNKIRMIELKTLCEELGFQEVTTYLQSGNVVFKTPTKSKPRQLAKDITARIKATFDYDVSVLVITGNDIHRVHQNNPFINKENTDTTGCYVTFLFNPSPKGLVESLSLPPKETGRFHSCENEIYVHCPDGYGKTKINNQFFEKTLKTSATTRNWNTINALLDLVSEDE
jgi:uncharacterized protein (DUF1697 family)